MSPTNTTSANTTTSSGAPGLQQIPEQQLQENNNSSNAMGSNSNNSNNARPTSSSAQKQQQHYNAAREAFGKYLELRPNDERAKQARNRKTQAILPIRGKILNVASATSTKIFANTEIADLMR